MGRLVEQTIPSFFNGVSRQPDIVRLPSQVEEGDNALFSVVTGGFEKRPRSEALVKLNLDTSIKRRFHGIDRGADGRYFLAINEDGSIHIWDMLTGDEETVTNEVQAYLATANPAEDLVCLTVEDYTFVVNRTKIVQMLPADASRFKGEEAKFNFLPSVRKWPKTGDYARVRNGGLQDDDEYYRWDGSQWTLEITGAPPANLQVVVAVREFSELPSNAHPDPVDGDIWRVTNEDTLDDDYFVRWDEDSGKWLMAADPREPVAFDPMTMPIGIVKLPNGEWEAKTIDWAPRREGDKQLVPEPSFVGRTIQDISFFKARLWLVSEENIVSSQASDYFNFWPDKATQSLDSDPIDRPANNNAISDLAYAVPFRRSLFLTSSRAQYELSGEGFLTPRSAIVDLSTTYSTSTRCRPVTMGDELYFSAASQGMAKVFEYFYDDQTISNTAADVTKHAEGYLPAEITKMSADAATSTLFILTDGRPGGIYVYKSYWDGQQKVQSSWAWWDIGASKIHETIFIEDYLYMVVQRGFDVFFERISPTREKPIDTLMYTPLLDCFHENEGVYDPEEDRTYWTLVHRHEHRAEIVLGPDFGPRKGKVFQPRYEPDGYSVSVPGDQTEGFVYAGLPYRMYVKLSKQFLRTQEGQAVIEGRLQLRSMIFSYTDTGYFEVHVTPLARKTKVYRMTGRVLGSKSNVIDGFEIETGKFRTHIGSNAETVEIALINDSPLPCVITAATWVGFFNQVTAQES